MIAVNEPLISLLPPMIAGGVIAEGVISVGGEVISLGGEVIS